VIEPGLRDLLRSQTLVILEFVHERVVLSRSCRDSLISVGGLQRISCCRTCVNALRTAVNDVRSTI
jgi:hypothetical protein